MKQVFTAAILVAAMASCKKSTDSTPAALTLTKADFTTNFKPSGTAYAFGEINVSASPVAIPARGDNQTWNFSTLTETSTSNFGGSNFLTPSNTAFASATYATLGTTNWSVSGVTSTTVPSNTFYEVNDNGIFYLGYSQNAVSTLSVPSLGLTLSYPVQNLNFTGTTKYPNLSLPATLGDSVITSNITTTSNYTATAPAFGLNNTPAQTRITTTTTQVIIARGTATLRNLGAVRVLVLRENYSDRSNYFLGGAPAPAALLSNLGLVDGAVTTGIIYRIYGEGLGIVGILETNSNGTSITGARFRK